MAFNWTDWKLWALGGAAGVGVILVTNREVLPKSQPFTLSSTKRAYVATMWNAVGAALPELSVPARLLVIAHAAYESGYGKSPASQGGANMFNLVRGSTALWPGPIITGGDLEYRNGQPVKITQEFRKYSSLSAGLADYFHSFLNYARYRSTSKPMLIAGNAQWVVQLGRDGFYTLPQAKYWLGYREILLEVIGAADELTRQNLQRPANL